MAVSWYPIPNWDDQGWRDRAACRRTDADLFFPTGTTGDAIDQIEAAKGVCRACPVQTTCLQFSLETNQEAGIWGGKDEDERRRLRQAWRIGRRSAVRSAAAR